MSKFKTFNLSQVLLTSAAFMALVPTTASAQSPQPAKPAAIEEIVVTGSRIIRDNFNSVQPISVVTAQSIRESGSTSVVKSCLISPLSIPRLITKTPVRPCSLPVKRALTFAALARRER